MEVLYQTKEEARKAAALVNDLAFRDPEELARALQQRPELLRLRAANPGLQRIVNALSSLDKQRERLTNDATLGLGPDARRAQIAQLAAQERQLFAAAQELLTYAGR